VLEQNSQVKLGVYKARGGKPGTALVRVIHAAPEFGSPQLTVDGKVAVKSLAYTKATPYVALPAGSHKLGAERQGGSTPLMSAALPVTDGKSYSVVVVGTRGQKVRVVPLLDRGGPSAQNGRTSVVSGSHSTSAHSIVVVRPGDSLWSIARRLSGSQASNETVEEKLLSIWDANSGRIGTGDPNLIFPGTRLVV
jgi:nucleoid-associated protein YgaU